MNNITERKTFKEFQELNIWLKTKPNRTEILKRFYLEIDKKKGYGSNRQSVFAKESLYYLIKEEGKK